MVLTLNVVEYLYNQGNQRTRLTRTDASYYTNDYDNIGQLVWADSTVASEDRGYLYDAAWNLNGVMNGSVPAIGKMHIRVVSEVLVNGIDIFLKAVVVANFYDVVIFPQLAP